MYLERFVAHGYLDADRAARLSWESSRHVSRIYLIVGERRLLAQNLSLCWADLGVGPGTPIAVEVTSGDRRLLDDEQRAIADFADRFRAALIPPEPRRARRGFFRRAR
ncbi:hypothetical protein HWD35_04745 [Tsukamurella tyrosinosolvens]|uniref:Uncharacterized protein n=1 Tax=Tsukamurella tyrosinosolvens TaxID=57704 RepID=A0A1H4QXY7_TSUTY|nr:hypothetical protein [Tsukamurella tyrosinosolvens]KXO91460.1 hypothetical protein AXK58_19835 [Tsukamurella tyrosinosolvens]KXP05437.1 hypothetical protein AXK59_07715 [Tsukamurella tyrosinosolvens]KZL95253.1 hypothetical protein AXX05_18740 [Tsukamurella tyrosinosolvens]MCA4994016.1 hypothetical protein [Tsukamurella tyrosinosolvens]MEC4612858.1 hypothetical protein [Tsukamurella tyrosinosolvens]